MKINLKIWGPLATLLVVVAILTLVVVLIVANRNFELIILHNNDMHARFEQTSRLSGVCNNADKQAGKCYGGFARVASLVNEAREAANKKSAPPVLYLNAGDTYTGTVWFSIFKWEIAAAFLNMLRPDAVSLGNHEFDNGVSGLTPFIHNLSCPVLAANIDLINEPTLAAEHNLKKSIVLEIEDKKVGIIGYLTPDTRFLSAETKVEYIDEVVAIRREVQKLTNEGVDILIALGHSGYETDIRIAREVDGIDLVIGGHTNTFLWNGTSPDLEEVQGYYPTMITQSSGRMVPVVEAYAYTKYLGRLHLVFNSDGELLNVNGSPILLDDSVPQDEKILELLEEYRPEVANIVNEVVGTTAVLLDGDTLSCRLKECNMGNLITDSIVYYYTVDNEVNFGWTDTAVALLQGGGIRSSIDARSQKGQVSRGDLLTVLPFDNNIAKVTVTGAILLSVLEKSVEEYNKLSPTGSFMQMSGIRVTYDLSKQPGSRVVSAMVRCSDCFVPQYFPLQLSSSYNILITSFLTSGGDGYYMLRDNTTNVALQTYDEVHTTTDYLQRRSPVYPEIAGRITLIGELNNVNRRK